jgi:hypothetical protein
MATQTLCQACGKPNPGQARFCEDCGQALQMEATSRRDTAETQTPFYVSTYHVARTTARFISAVGWIVFAVGVLMLLLGFVGIMDAASRGDRANFGIAGLLSVPSLGCIIGGLLLVGFGQSSRALVDTADFTGEMLAILKMSQASEKSGVEQS